MKAPQQSRSIALCSLLVVAFLSGCAVAPTNTASGSGGAVAEPVPSAPVALTALVLAGTEWAALAIDGKTQVVNPKPKLRWLTADKITGTGGCNGFTGPSVATPDSLRLGPLASTGRACLSMPGSQEDMFFKALELTRKAKLERDQLVLMDEAGKQLARLVRTN